MVEKEEGEAEGEERGRREKGEVNRGKRRNYGRWRWRDTIKRKGGEN